MFRCILKIIFILLASYIYIFYFWLDVIFGWRVVFLICFLFILFSSFFNIHVNV